MSEVSEEAREAIRSLRRAAEALREIDWDQAADRAEAIASDVEYWESM